MRAKKSLGQNFLTDAGVAARIIREFGPRAGETVVEIGPGRGALTAQLVGRVERVVAIELDRELVSVLRDRFGGREDVTVIEADALAADLCQLIAPAGEARVVANLPYYISTAILQRLIAQRACLTELVLMLQREVVARITARAGERERGYLSVLIEASCEAEHLFDVPPSAFRPAPKVWSSVVRLHVRRQWPEEGAALPDESVLWALVSAGFSRRRKTICNNLRQAGGTLGALIESVGGGAAALLARSDIEPQRRAETLTLAEWTRLARGL